MAQKESVDHGGRKPTCGARTRPAKVGGFENFGKLSVTSVTGISSVGMVQVSGYKCRPKLLALSTGIISKLAQQETPFIPNVFARHSTKVTS